MPRLPRQKSSLNLYHIVIKGTDRQLLFEDNYDRRTYLELLKKYKDECEFYIYAYCLMSNHVHLVIQVNDISLETIFRKLNTHYAVWFNMKYDRTGHLLQNRYHSEAIEDIRYLLEAIHYVHCNPLKAGLEDIPGTEYRWSSIYEYKTNNSFLIDTDIIYQIIDQQSFLNYTSQFSEQTFWDINKSRSRTPDDVARQLIVELCNCKSVTEFQNLPQNQISKNIILLHKKGLNSRQLNRLTGISRGKIERIIINNQSINNHRSSHK